MKKGVNLLLAIFIFVGCGTDIEKLAKDDSIRGEAKENLRLCEKEKDFKACYLLARAYSEGRMAKQSDEKALLYFEKSCKLRNEAYSKLAMPSLDKIEDLRVKFGINSCEMAAHSKTLQSGFKKWSEFLRSEKAMEIVPFFEQSCLSEYASCFMSAEYHLIKGNYEKAKEFGLYSCLRGESEYKNGCEYYSENVLKKKPYFRD